MYSAIRRSQVLRLGVRTRFRQPTRKKTVIDQNTHFGISHFEKSEIKSSNFVKETLYEHEMLKCFWNDKSQNNLIMDMWFYNSFFSRCQAEASPQTQYELPNVHIRGASDMHIFRINLVTPKCGMDLHFMPMWHVLRPLESFLERFGESYCVFHAIDRSILDHWTKARPHAMGESSERVDEF